ncbi:unnamed protein product [Candidula unifasciata]|uniref:Uncharacterized protein n=1 Tax=Candidula unifasciata TaxID=100452 RepID=A0A8S3YXI9_9EUPU|nr:unnamed protein product [Candidula unifasciata]
MASSIGVPAFGPQDVQLTHAEKSGSEKASQQKPCFQSSITIEAPNNIDADVVAKPLEPSVLPVSNAIPKSQTTDASSDVLVNATVVSSVTCDTGNVDAAHQLPSSSTTAAKTTAGSSLGETVSTDQASSSPAGKTLSPTETLVDKPSAINTSDSKEIEKAAETSNHTESGLKPSSNVEPLSAIDSNNGQAKTSPEPVKVIGTSTNHDTVNPSLESAPSKIVPNKNSKDGRLNNNKHQLEDGEELEKPEKKAKLAHTSNTAKGRGKTPEQIFELMDKTFEQRRNVVTKQMPTIPELKELYPDLFTGKQLLLEFQRITKIDIDQKIQEFCVRHATAVIELAKHRKEAAPVLARWEQAKQENDTLKQYWDMVTALCLLPLHFGENFVEMVLEIGEDEEVVAQGKIVPTLVARGNIFRTDEFFLIAENTIVQEFEEFTIAFASLYSSYWVFNMEYPKTIENTYNYIQRCIVRQREPGAIPIACKNFTKTLLKWNKGKEGK